MSYSIMYNWQFLKSEEGLTPVVLMGDNNVTTSVWMGNHWGERCARDWSCLFNFIGVTEEEFMSAIQSLTGKSYQEHWKHNGKWVDDKGIINWAKNACKKAASVEQVAQLNPYISIKAQLSVWSKEDKHSYMLDEYIHSTAELDGWLRSAKPTMAALRQEGSHVYPIISFSSEKLRRCSAMTDQHPDKVLMKCKYGYVSGYDEESRTLHFNRDIKKALIMDYDTAVRVQTKEFYRSEPALRLVSAKAQEEPYDAIIRVTRRGDSYSCYYVSRTGSRKTYFVGDPRSAKKYRNMKVAEQTAERLTARSEQYNYEAIQLFSLEEAH